LSGIQGLGTYLPRCYSYHGTPIFLSPTDGTRIGADLDQAIREKGEKERKKRRKEEGRCRDE
jgi:hypothetical protein